MNFTSPVGNLQFSFSFKINEKLYIFQKFFADFFTWERNIKKLSLFRGDHKRKIIYMRAMDNFKRDIMYGVHAKYFKYEYSRTKIYKIIQENHNKMIFHPG